MNDNYRNNGISVLSTVLKNKKNIDIIEKNIYRISNDEEEYNNNLYEVITLIENKSKLKNILQKIKSKNLLWDSNIFIEAKNRIEEHDHFILYPFEIEEGVMECNRCGSNKTYSYTKQTRSGDEATTVFAICCKCNNRWKM